MALHDEELIYQREVAELRAQGLSVGRWDNIGFWFSYKAVLLEGVEVAFIVIALGAQGGTALQAAILGAAAAFVLTMVAGALLRKPLSFVPENWMKFVVGAMLTTFGIYWGAEGFAIQWPLGESTLLLLVVGISAVSWVSVRMLTSMLPTGAQAPRATSSDRSRTTLRRWLRVKWGCLMMGFLAAVWENVYDLLVEDGSIALGTVIALILVGLWTFVMSSRPELAAWAVRSCSCC